MAEYRKTVSGAASRLYETSRRRALARGMPFELTSGWILRQIEAQDQRCAVTGIPFEVNAPAFHPWKPSLDRIDPNGGYTTDNAQVVVLMYNLCKHLGSLEDVQRFARAILQSDP